MTGFDALREELKNRGCSSAQCESKVVAVVVDVLSNNKDLYTKIQEEEITETKHLRELASDVRRIEKDLNALQWRRIKIISEMQDAKDYIQKWNESLAECETPEGRDAMKRAQVFVNSVSVDTKYDNTAFIIGLSAILSEGKIGSIQELKKINPKIPEVRI